MSDDDDAFYDESTYPSVHYSQETAATIQALGTFIAQVGRVHKDHPIVAPAVAILEAMKPPHLKAVKGGKE
jgi:hypothetical protein